MPRSICASLIALLILVFAVPSHAQLPGEATMEKELRTIYLTKAPRLNLDRLTDEGRSLEPLMMGQGYYLYTELHPWEKDPAALLLTDGNHGEHGIRPNTHTAYGFAAMYRCLDASQFPEHWSREECRDAAIAILRFALPTHGAGGVLCSDGKPWTSQWQSALWAYAAGRAAWLLWDELDIELKWLAARGVGLD